MNEGASSRGAAAWFNDARLRELLAADLRALGALQVGVATSAFQTEGGLDGAGDPATNWSAWQREGRVERIDGACGLWQRFPDAVARLRGMGAQVFRLGLEWSRLAPYGERLDPRAIEGYAERIAAVRAAGLEPIVTLQHFTHPEWAGADFWLDEQAPQVFARYARGLVTQLGAALTRRGVKPVTRWVTINEPNMLATATYVAGVFPHGRGALAKGDPLGAPRALRAMDQLGAAHVRAYRAMHAAYAERGWGAPEVSWNVNFIDLYSFGTMLFDVLRAGEFGVAPSALEAHVARGRERFFSQFFAGESSPRVDAARSIEGLIQKFVSPRLFESTLGAMYERDSARVVDYLAIDVYDPWSHQQLRGGEALLAALSSGAPLLSLPAHVGSGIRLAEPWEWLHEPDVLLRAIAAVHNPERPLPIDVLENGMAQRRDPGAATEPRHDGVRRPEFVRGSAFAVSYARAVRALPVRAYCYWTLVDNYELGRYAPRFGLFALPDPPAPRAAAEWSRFDAAGDDAAGALAGFAGLVAIASAGGESARDGARRYFGEIHPKG